MLTIRCQSRWVQPLLEPSLNGGPSVVHVPTDPVALRPRTAMAPALQGVDGDAEHLRQFDDREQTLDLTRHDGPPRLTRDRRFRSSPSEPR